MGEKFYIMKHKSHSAKIAFNEIILNINISQRCMRKKMHEN